MNQLTLLTVLSTGCVMSQNRLDCRPETLNTCIKLADPLLEQPNYVFPAVSQDVDHVCNVLFPKTWSEFVTCIKQYTSDCLTSDQRSDFNRAVGDSINSVHKMCTNEDYKQDYLQHAGCIKEKSTTEVYCGNHYSTLVDMVKGVTPSTQRELCCSHRAFKDCVIHETRSCNTGTGPMNAQDFARAMLDKSLGFLLKQCQDYVPSRADCPGYDIPMEKTPRQMDGHNAGVDSDNYYPSGERKPYNDDHRDQLDDGWTNLNPLEPLPPLNNPEQREESLLPFDESDLDLQELEPLDPITESSYLDPVRSDDNRAPRPRLEDEDSWRKPWLPDLSKEIQPFDDLFSNVIDSSYADARTGAGSSPRQDCFILGTLLSILFYMWA